MFLKTLNKCFLLGFLLFFSSCGVNVFSIFSPTNPDGVEDTLTLVALGDQYLVNLDYTNAFKAYSKAMEKQPNNSRAIEGASTSYLYMRIPFISMMTVLLSSAYTSLNINTLFDVSSYLSTHLYTIIGKSADGVIPYNDVNINLNFYIFNTFSSLFILADTDNDRNIELDTNDLLIISNDFTLTERISGMTNSMISLLGAVNTLNSKKQGYYTAFTNSLVSLEYVNNALVTTEAKAMLQGIITPISGFGSGIDSIFSNFQHLNLTNTFGVGNYNLITNLFTNNYTVFTNQLYQEGITNPNDITNIIPDFTNSYGALTNYYGRASNL
jgi:hypothetical protein